METSISHSFLLLLPVSTYPYFRTDSFETSHKKSLKEKTEVLQYRPPNKHQSTDRKSLQQYHSEEQCTVSIAQPQELVLKENLKNAEGQGEKHDRGIIF